MIAAFRPTFDMNPALAKVTNVSKVCVVPIPGGGLSTRELSTVVGAAAIRARCGWRYRCIITVCITSAAWAVWRGGWLYWRRRCLGIVNPVKLRCLIWQSGSVGGCTRCIGIGACIGRQNVSIISLWWCGGIYGRRCWCRRCSIGVIETLNILVWVLLQ